MDLWVGGRHQSIRVEQPACTPRHSNHLRLTLWLKYSLPLPYLNFITYAPKFNPVTMTAELVSAFLVVVLKWLEVDDSVQPELLEKMECFAECLTRIARHMSISSLTEHLVTVWIMIRRVQCVLRGIDLESTSNISYRSMGGIAREPRGFTSLVELDDPQLTFEIEANHLLLEEWIMACKPEEPLELVLKLVRETFNDIRVIHRNLRR